MNRSFFSALFGFQINQMRNGRDALLLHDGGWTEQRARGNEQDIAIDALAHFVEDIAAQYRSAAPAAGAAGMDVLRFIKDHHAAIAVPLADVDPLFAQQISQQARTNPA